MFADGDFNVQAKGAVDPGIVDHHTVRSYVGGDSDQRASDRPWFQE